MDHPPGRIAEEDVDRIAHPKGVDLASRLQQQTRPGGQAVVPDQAADPLPDSARLTEVTDKDLIALEKAQPFGHVK